MPAKQARINHGRPLLLATADIFGAPSDGYESPQDALPLQAPHHIMSPRVCPGFRTSGIIIGLTQPSGGVTAAVAVAGGFELILWVANPTGWFWNRCTSVFVDYRFGTVSYDFDAAPLYIQIAATSVSVAGSIIFTLTEQ